MKNKEITAILKNGRRISTAFLMIYVSPEEVEDTKVSCVVGKKVSPLAVKRHSVQRKMREVARDFVSSAGIRNNMVWIAKPSISRLKNLADLRASINKERDKIIRSV